jgi:hypothetical protein
MKMKHFLSYGGGVNSTALYLYMVEKGIEFEAVFSNHEADHPDTYKYVQYFNNELIKRGLRPVTIIEGKVQEGDMEKPLGLYEYCLSKQVVPNKLLRWCTEKFKILPTNLYINSQLEGGADEKCYYHLGIAADEEKRAHPPKNPPVYLRNKVYQYLFVEDGIDRQGNIDIIKKHGLEVPKKSGCYFCPFAPIREFRQLYLNDPCLYEKLKYLEHKTNERRLSQGKELLYMKGRPIEAIVKEGNLMWTFNDDGELDEISEGRRPCNCGL